MFKKYSTKDGLLNNGIYSLARSKNGLWWIGTGIGLQRFDGYTFETWNEPDDTSGTTAFGAQNVFEDSHENVWVFNYKMHYVFPASSKKLKPIFPDSSKSVSNPDYYPLPVMEYNGRVWCFQGNSGFFGFNMKTYKIDTVVQVTFRQIKNESIPSLPSVSTDENNTVWATQDFEDSSFVVRFKPGEEVKKTILPVNKYGRVKAYIPVGENKFLFISTTYTALCHGDDFENPVKILSAENIPGNFIRGLPYEKLKVYNKGSFIFPGEKGIYEYVPSTQTLQPYTTSVYPDINLTRQLMFSLKEDDWGNIWIARDASDGLLVYYPGKLKFEFLKAPSRYFNLVYSLAIDENRNVIASNFQKGLNVFDRKGEWRKYVALPKTENGLSPSIRAMQFIDRKHLVLKSLYDKLMILNTDDYSLKDITSQLPEQVAAQKNVFDANIIKTGENEIQFTHGNYILGVKKKDTDYSVYLVDSLFLENSVTSLAYSSMGKRIIGTSGGCYIKEEGKWVKIQGTENLTVKHISVDGSGTIWAAGNHGIYAIEDKLVVRKYNEATGLLNEFIYGILFDNDGNTWYSSNRGLGCIHKNGSVSFFTEADGLQGDEFDTQSFWKGDDGKLYFGGINGITAFYPGEVLQPVKAGKIIMSGIQVNGDTYPKEGRVDDVTSIELPYHQNALGFNFTLTDYSDADYNVYQVKLDGFDNDWMNQKNAHSIRYLLSPGDYMLHVKGSNDGSTWSEEFILPITIHSAWWQTVWFKWFIGISLITASGAGTWYYNKTRTTRLKQQLQLEHEMQKERERISRDLHDNIGAYSTALIANTDSLEQIIQDDEGKEKILYLKENARNILSTIRETIWLLNSDNLTIAGFTEGFINYCTNILRNHEGIEIEFKEDVILNKNLSPTTAINLLRILQEVIQNTVKHARATKINCYIKSDEHLVIQISDNGKGFKYSEKTYGYGLKNIKLRADEINFNVDLKSAPGEGTEITLSGNV
jgi:signal transduction histidine kinase